MTNIGTDPFRFVARWLAFWLFLLTWFVALVEPTAAALLPPDFLDSVGAIGHFSNPNNTDKPEWFTEGTGFFFGHLIKNDADPTKRLYEVFFITAKHVVQEHAANQIGDIEIRLNPQAVGAAPMVFSTPSRAEPSSNWFFHPDGNTDLALVHVDGAALRKAGIAFSFYPDDVEVAGIDKLKSLQVSAGDGAFVLGFPMNLAGHERNFTIVKSASIARMNEMLAGSSNTFLIDALVFPGNSGSPVVLRPEIAAIQGTQSNRSAYLIGMVISYLPYRDTAFSGQTREARIVFEENSGLAEVIPVDRIEEAITAWHEAFDVPHRH